jgi:dihydroxyacid dehydratase/phosphogluconate dehydratase
MCAQTAELYIEPPNYVEVEMATSQLKNGKATGNDQMPATLIKRRKTAQECNL